MSVRRTVALTGRALRPGADLSHNANYLTAVDALIALGRVKEPAGAMVVHAKLAGENIDVLQQIILEMATVEFERRGWKVVGSKRQSKAKIMKRFAEQVWREFFGQPCHRCKGHGVLGRKLDTVRHRLDNCAVCKGAGFVLSEITHEPREGSEYFFTSRYRRAPCSACRGQRYVRISEELKAGKLRSCQVCEGTGIVRNSVRARAKALDVSRMAVWRRWDKRFLVLLSELRRIERSAIFESANFLFGKW